MKKITGILSLFVVTITLLSNVETKKTDSSFSLESLKFMNEANAELPQEPNKMPSAVLCPGGAQYKTDCVGNGNGCSATSCPEY